MPPAARPLSVLLATAALGASLWAVPVRAQAGARPAPATAYAAAAFTATNVHRVAHGRVPLWRSACLTRLAQRWARHMAGAGRLDHQRLSPVAARCRVSWVGENIAVGYPSGRAVVNRGWMRSSGHRANILRPKYRLMGIGAFRDRQGRWWTSQVFGRR
jgi:uncharacterized protein YkwD